MNILQLKYTLAIKLHKNEQGSELKNTIISRVKTKTEQYISNSSKYLRYFNNNFIILIIHF